MLHISFKLRDFEGFFLLVSCHLCKNLQVLDKPAKHLSVKETKGQGKKQRGDKNSSGGLYISFFNLKFANKCHACQLPRLLLHNRATDFRNFRDFPQTTQIMRAEGFVCKRD